MAESHRDEIAKLEALYASNPGGRVFVHLAEALRKAGEYERARNILEEGLGRHSDSASGYVVLGRLFADLQEDVAAEGAFRRVMELDAGNLIALRGLADLALRGGSPAAAAGYYRDLLARNPSSDDVRHLLAEAESAATAASAQEARGDVDQAAAADREAEAWLEEPAASDEVSPRAHGEHEAAYDADADDAHADAGGLMPDAPVAPYSAAPGDTGDAEPAEPEFGVIDLNELPGDLAGLTGAGLPQEPEDGADFNWDSIGTRDADLTDLIASDPADTRTDSWHTGELASQELDVSELSAGVQSDDPSELLAGELMDAPGFEVVEPVGPEEWAGMELLDADDGWGDEPGEGYMDSLELGLPEESERLSSPDEAAWPPAPAEPAGEWVEGSAGDEADWMPAPAEPAGEWVEGAAGDEADWMPGEPAGESEGSAEAEWLPAEPAGESPAGAPEGEAELGWAPELESVPAADAADSAAVQGSGDEAEPPLDDDYQVGAAASLQTETMADLYSMQGFHGRAAEVYRALLRQRPDDERLAARLRAAEEAHASSSASSADEAGEAWLRGSAWAAGATDHHAPETTPYAWHAADDDGPAEEPAPPGPDIRSYLRDLVGWRPSASPDEPRGDEPVTGGTGEAGEPTEGWFSWEPPLAQGAPQQDDAREEAWAAEPADADAGMAGVAGEAWASEPDGSAAGTAAGEGEPWTPDADQADDAGMAAAEDEPWAAAEGAEAPAGQEPWSARPAAAEAEAAESDSAQPEELTLEVSDAWTDDPWSSPDAPSGEQQPQDSMAPEGAGQSGDAPQDPWASADAADEPWAMPLASQPAPAEQGTDDPWAEPVSAEQGADDPWAQPRPVDDVAAAFDEWYAGDDSADAPAAAEAEPEAAPDVRSAAGAEQGEDEDDEDLAMFRSWLQSLKK